MKFVDEYRNPKLVRDLAAKIAATSTRPWNIMEVCGGQTHAILRFGIDELLPDTIALIHGPGCPVCVTPVESIDRAILIASRPEAIFCSFGDMLRVPGSKFDLLSAKAGGGDVRIVYSPLDALRLAQQNPEKQVVFFAVGFETTAPATALAVAQAEKLRVENFSLLVAHVLIPPAMEAMVSSKQSSIDAFLAAGHVCTVTGAREYVSLSERYSIPIAITGFEPVDILQGIAACVLQLESGRCEVVNSYSRSVKQEGNRSARELIARVYQAAPRKWRGIGEIPDSGLRLRDRYASFDAEKRFQVSEVTSEESDECISGLVLQGLRKPHECPAFGTTCTPERPLGATMVSSEGACAAYYQYRRG